MLEPRELGDHDRRRASLCDDINCEHDDHECTCAEIAADRAEREAEAMADMTYAESMQLEYPHLV